jgi:crossover junction endodeoxyribonuclease RusA
MRELSLPWPPSINHYYRRVGNRTLISKPGRLYRRAVVGQLRPMDAQPLLGRLAVTIYAHPPDRRRRDLDNIQKALLDALQHAGVYADDSQIDSLAIHRCNPVPNGRVRLTITETPYTEKKPCS